MRTKYVACFMFNKDMSQLVMRLPNERGKLDVIRGEIKQEGNIEDLDVSTYHAAIRVFEKETEIHNLEWNRFACFVGSKHKVYMFHCSTDAALFANNSKDFSLVSVFDVVNGFVLSEEDLNWLVQLAVSGTPVNVTAEIK